MMSSLMFVILTNLFGFCLEVSLPAHLSTLKGTRGENKKTEWLKQEDKESMGNLTVGASVQTLGGLF